MPDVTFFLGDHLPEDLEDWKPDNNLIVGSTCMQQHGIFHTDLHKFLGKLLRPFTADRNKHPLHLPRHKLMEA